MKMDIATTLKKTTYYIVPYIGLTLYGFDVILSLFFLFCFLCVMDVVLGYTIARLHNSVSSSAGSKGFMNKVVWVVLLAGMIGFLANMGHAIDNERAIQRLSIFVLLTILIRVGFEVVSILENLAIISNKRESVFIARIISIFLKIAGIGKKKIEEKIERYLDDKKTNG